MLEPTQNVRPDSNKVPGKIALAYWTNKLEHFCPSIIFASKARFGQTNYVQRKNALAYWTNKLEHYHPNLIFASNVEAYPKCKARQ
jgi:hypothetical protein